MKSMRVLALAGLPGLAATVEARNAPRAWYEQGDFAPRERVEVCVHNDLDRARTNSPVVIAGDQRSAVRDVDELAITLADPTLPGRPERSDELLAHQRGHEARGAGRRRCFRKGGSRVTYFECAVREGGFTLRALAPKAFTLASGR